MGSAYRCEHALNEAFITFQTGIKDIELEVKSRFVENFGSRLDEVIASAMAEYKETANKYDQEEATEKYKALVDKIETQIQFLFNLQYKWLETKVIDVFQFEMDQALPNGQCVDDLNGVVNRAAESAKLLFNSKMAECMINTENKEFLQKTQYWNETQKRLRERTKNIQLEQWQLLQKENEHLADEHLLGNITKLLSSPTQSIWRDVSTLRIQYHGQYLQQHIMSKLDKLMYDEMKLKEKKTAIKNLSDQLIVDRCKRYCGRMDSVLQEVFDGFFNKDPATGVPRTWNESVNLDEIFVVAKEKALEILKLCGQIFLEENVELDLQPIKLRLFSSSDLEESQKAFNKFADDEYRRAQRDIQYSNQLGGGMLPTHPVTWAVFLFFAKDEIWSMLTNPLYLIMVVLLVIGGAVAYQAHMYGIDVKSVFLQMISKAVNAFWTWASDFQRRQQEIQRRGRERERPSPTMMGGMNPTDDDTTTTAGR